VPGIFGVIDRVPDDGRAPERVDLVRRMAAAMQYDPAYVTDIVACSSLSACAGRVGWPYQRSTNGAYGYHTRPSILTAGEPVLATDNLAAGPDDCDAIGTGAHAIAQRIDQCGLPGLAAVQGPFAGFLIDRRGQRCVLFNDRYGAERLFVCRVGDRIFFGSEAKAILAVAPEARRLDPQGLAEWFACGCTIGEHSLFKGVEVLGGGTALTFHGYDHITRTRYFEPSVLEQPPVWSLDRFTETFSTALHRAVNEAVDRTPGAALSLTGGLDSRMVLACLDGSRPPVHCYTFGSMYRPTFDVTIARAVASACDQPHHVLSLDRGFLNEFNDCLRQAVYVSDGYIGFSGSAELYVNRLARAVAPARVTGNWGGELMRTVRAFKHRVPKGNFLEPPMQQLVREAGQTFARTTHEHPLSFTLFHQMPHQGYGRYAVERSQVIVRSPFLANDVVETLYQAPAAARGSVETVLRILRSRPALAAIPTDTGRLGQGPAFVRLLRRAYRRAVIKSEYLTGHGAPDWFATLSARMPVLEAPFVGRDKFQHFRRWMRDEMSGFVRSVLLDDGGNRLSPWFDRHRVSTMVEEHIAGRANYTDELDKIVTVVLMRDRLAVQ
jgi:asparagine synthase (glutamine-hydrolysing)